MLTGILLYFRDSKIFASDKRREIFIFAMVGYSLQTKALKFEQESIQSCPNTEIECTNARKGSYMDEKPRK